KCFALRAVAVGKLSGSGLLFACALGILRVRRNLICDFFGKYALYITYDPIIVV
ncbi:hypothetical protein ACJX0J_009139, partial [Zea mays]